MEFWAKVLEVLDAGMTKPESYGIFHIAFFVVSILAGIVLCRVFKNPDDRLIRKIVGILSVVLIVLEIYKQINYSFSYSEGITFDYQWYAFPFQFCSTPMYVGLLAALFKKGRVHDSACAYLASFAFFAGLAVMFYPETVFIETIGINIQTMVCHGSMVTMGIFLLGSGYVKSEHKTVLKALPIFVGLVTLAVIFNEIAYRTGLLETETFNMFFVSPYCEPSLPVYSLVQGIVPFPWCLFIYVIGFSLAAYIIVLCSMAIWGIAKRKRTSKSDTTSEMH